MGPGSLQPLEWLQGTGAKRSKGLGAWCAQSGPALAGLSCIRKELWRTHSQGGWTGMTTKPIAPQFGRVKDFKMAAAESQTKLALF